MRCRKLWKVIFQPSVALLKRRCNLAVSLPYLSSTYSISMTRFALSQKQPFLRSTDPNVRQHSVEVKRKPENRKKHEGSNILTIPNILCFCRIGFTPLITYLVVKESYMIALLAFSFAGITDWLDGFIARNVQNQKSLLGSVIDPLADKLLVMTLFIILAHVDLIPLPLTALVILRDVGLIAGGAVIRYKLMDKPVTFFRYFNSSIAPFQVKPTFVSKVNTALQMCVIGGNLAAASFNFTGHSILTYLNFATAVTTVYSGLQYVRLTRMKRVNGK